VTTDLFEIAWFTDLNRADHHTVHDVRCGFDIVVYFVGFGGTAIPTSVSGFAAVAVVG
jgi:hypothetical protein